MSEAVEITPAVLARRLAARVEDVARWVFPNGARHGDDWCVGSLRGEAGKSLKVALEGERAGRWADFADQDEKERGDLLDLLCLANEWSMSRAINEACKFLQIERVVWGERKKREEYAEPERPRNGRSLNKAPAVNAWLATRKISPETAARYKLIADGDHTLVYPYLRQNSKDEEVLVHLKYRDTREKKFWSSKDTEMCLFGWHALDPHVRAVAIVEGEQDVLAMAEYGYQALSVPYGAGKKHKQDWIENEWERLERFDTIFVVIDMDGAGMKAVQELVERLGRPRCRVVKLPRKDANACLMDGVSRSQIATAFSLAKTIDPAELRNSGDFTDQIIERFYPKDPDALGFKLPWPGLAHSFTMSWGALTFVAGFPGHGKSELAGQIILDAARQKIRACVGSFEFKTSKWLARMVRQSLGDERPSPDHIRAAMGWFADYIWAIDVAETAKSDRLLELFEYAHRRYNCRLFVVDNFSKLGIADDDLAEQKRVITIFTEFARRLDVHVIIVHHLRKNEDTDKNISQLSKMSLKGSGALMDLADNIWLVFRNRTKEQKLKEHGFSALPPEEQQEIRGKPDTVFRCEKYRDGDEEPVLPLWFNKKAHTWQDQPGGLVYHYVKVATE